jgi:hypothetical protein
MTKRIEIIGATPKKIGRRSPEAAHRSTSMAHALAATDLAKKRWLAGLVMVRANTTAPATRAKEAGASSAPQALPHMQRTWRGAGDQLS